MSQRASYSFYWVFTLNNPGPSHLQDVQGWPDIKYCVYQVEQGEQGTEHLQGYAIFANKKRLAWLKAHCNAEAHWELRRGSHEQAKAYSTKESTRKSGPYEVGVEPEGMGGQGKRNDLLALKRALDDGQSEKEIAESDELFAVWAKYGKVIPRYKQLKAEHQRNWQTEVVVLWGPPGSGKSSRAHAEAGPGAFWLSKPSAPGAPLYWDGYDGQEHVVIDEFYGWVSRDLMQRLVDRYPLLVQQRGSAAPFVARKIWITSNTPPEQWWPKVGLGAMQRRFAPPIGVVEFVDFPVEVIEHGVAAPGVQQPAQFVRQGANGDAPAEVIGEAEWALFGFEPADRGPEQRDQDHGRQSGSRALSPTNYSQDYADIDGMLAAARLQLMEE